MKIKGFGWCVLHNRGVKQQIASRKAPYKSNDRYEPIGISLVLHLGFAVMRAGCVECERSLVQVIREW